MHATGFDGLACVNGDGRTSFVRSEKGTHRSGLLHQVISQVPEQKQEQETVAVTAEGRERLRTFIASLRDLAASCKD
jgi:hypothetical protein